MSGRKAELDIVKTQRRLNRLYQVSPTACWLEVEEAMATSAKRRAWDPKRERIPSTSHGNIPWVKSGELPDGIVAAIEERITEEAVAKSSAKLFPAWHSLIALYGATVGKLGILKEDATTNQAVCAIFPPETLDTKYLFWYLRFVRSDLVAQAIGGAQPNISQGILRTLPIPTAPLDQQKRIVAEIEKQFSRLDEAVANLKRVKANLKRYKAAVLKAAVEGRLVETEAELARREGRSYETGEQLLQRILETRRSQWKGKGKYKEPAAPDTTDLPELPEGWVWASAVQACDPVVDCHNKTAPYVESGILLVRTSNIRDGRLLLDDIRNVDEPTYYFWSRRCPPMPGDVLFTREAPMGEAAIIPQGTKLCMGQRMMLMRPSGAIDVAFLLYSLQSPVIKELIQRTAVGSGVKHLRVSDVEMLPIPIPPREEQHRIRAEVDRRLSLLHETEFQVGANLLRAVRLRQAVLNAAFSGGLSSITSAQSGAQKLVSAGVIG